MTETFFTPFSEKNQQQQLLHAFKAIDRQEAIEALKKMLLIRNFEIRAEVAYQQGKVGGFFHSYIGQEAIQIAAVFAFGLQNWYITSYRCHALALLLGATPNEIMAELYGKATGNAKGRGGSMHLYTEKLLGGFGIVGGQIPVAIGAAFSLKYQKKSNELAICFFGEGAVAQGAFHESLNLAALWNLPCIFIIENNQWGMGTNVENAISVKPIAETKGPSFGIKGYSLDGMNFFHLYASFNALKKEVLSTQRPILIEVFCQRFKGHSVSDPGLYRSKESLSAHLQRDPLVLMQNQMKEAGYINEETYKALDKEQKELVIQAMKYADESPWPSSLTLEDDVFAP